MPKGRRARRAARAAMKPSSRKARPRRPRPVTSSLADDLKVWTPVLWLVVSSFFLVRNAVDDVRLNAGPRASGTVVAVQEVTRTRPEAVTVAFTTRDGTAARAKVITGVVHDAPPIGAVVTLAYDPSDPAHARLIGADDLTDLAGLTVLLAVICVAVLVRAPRNSPVIRPNRSRWRLVRDHTNSARRQA